MPVIYLGHEYKFDNSNITIPARTSLVVCATISPSATMTLGGETFPAIARNTSPGDGTFFARANPPIGSVAQVCSLSDNRREFWYFYGALRTGNHVLDYGTWQKTASIAVRDDRSMVVWCNFIRTSENVMSSSQSGFTSVVTSNINSGDYVWGYGHTITNLAACSTYAKNSDVHDEVSVNIMEILPELDEGNSTFLSDFGVV